MIRAVLITDRRLLAGTALTSRIAAILAAVPAGAVAIQLREKDLDGGPLTSLARSIVDVTLPARAPLYINDRLDVALAVGADGVHLPEMGIPVDVARSLAPSLRIGCSRHTHGDTLSASTAGADLVQLGPFGAVVDKGEPLPPSMLTSVRQALPLRTGLVAVGGVDSPARAHDLAAMGADAVALIRAWQQPPTDQAAATFVRGLVDAVDAGIAARPA